MAKDKASDLTDKQLLFCQEYLKDLNGTQAAIRAGYSVNSAAEIAAQNLIKLNIQNKIQELKAKRSDKVEITADMVLAELAKIAFSNIQDFTDNTNGVANINNLEANKAAAISSIESNTRTIGEDATVSITKLKLHDKMKALDLIGKHIGFFEKDNDQQNKILLPPPTAERIQQIKDKLKNEY